MHISSLIIRNFRNFENAVFKFNKGVNTIIGENGSGKTNAFYALRILLDSKLPRYVNNLLEGDFNRSLKSWKGHWIVISLNFEELTADEAIQCLSFLEAGIPDGTNRGNYNYFFRPKYHVRKEIFELSDGEERDEDALREKLENLTIADYEYVITVGASNMDFSNDDFYREHVGDFETLTFPNPEEDDISALGQFNNVLNIYNDVSCTFAEALRDVVSDLKNYRNNPLITLLKSSEDEIDDETSEEIQTTIKGLNEKISNLEPVRGVSSGIVSTIKDTVGETYAPSVDIEANLPDEMSSLLRSLALKVGDGDEPDYKGRIEELSLGGANLIYLSLKLLEYSLELKKDKAAHFLLIEEPEAHIHTHIQKTLFQKLKDDNTQIIYSTHSTHISEVSKIRSVNILARTLKKAEVYHPSHGLTDPEVTRLERYLDAIRTTLLFAKSVILVEGDAELILIPAMVKKVYGVSLDELGVSLINIGSTGFQNVARIFHSDRIRKKCAILTDLDESIFDLPDNPEDDNGEQKDARNSQIDGVRRKTELDDFCNGNEWLAPFYAQHTFEVELISYRENEGSLCEVVDIIYQQEANRTQSKNRLKDDSVAVYGKEILRLAKKQKKGWFAIDIANHLDNKFILPGYIDDALAFVNTTLNSSIIKKIAIHRITNFDNDTDLIKKIKSANLDDFDSVKNIFSLYEEKVGHDFVCKQIKKILLGGILTAIIYK